MGFLDILQSIPGLSKLNIKFAVEMYSKQIIAHVKHPVDKYNATINFKTGFIEFLVFYPGDTAPATYKNPVNLMFKGERRNVPDNARLYDIDVKSGIDTIKGFIESNMPDFKGDIDFVILYVDRDKKEIPCEVYLTNEGKKEKFNHVLK